MTCKHNGTVIILEPKLGGCLECHRKVVLAERLERDTRFTTPIHTTVKYWTDIPGKKGGDGGGKKTTD